MNRKTKRKDAEPTEHAVSLPSPVLGGRLSKATCSCGWTTVYGWGQMPDATQEAARHIRYAANCAVIQDPGLDGTTRLMQGRAL